MRPLMAVSDSAVVLYSWVVFLDGILSHPVLNTRFFLEVSYDEGPTAVVEFIEERAM